MGTAAQEPTAEALDYQLELTLQGANRTAAVAGGEEWL